jgi:hypothetical protein
MDILSFAIGLTLGIILAMLSLYKNQMQRDKAMQQSYNNANMRFQTLEAGMKKSMADRTAYFNTENSRHLNTIREVFRHRDEYATGFARYVAQRLDPSVLSNMEAHIPRLLKDYEAGLEHNKHQEPLKSGL